MASNMGPDGVRTTNDCNPRGTFSTLTFYPYDNSYRGVAASSSSSVEYTIFSCVRDRPLRIKQRDDRFNSPRVRNAYNSPTSRQDSLRANWGSNTYI